MNNVKLSKIITIGVLIIVVLAIILLLSGSKDTATIRLIGEEKMTIYQFDQFIDPGYEIVDTDNKTGFYINIDGYVNTNIIGTYYLKYLLYNKSGSLVSEAQRQVTVLEDDLSNIQMYLKGEAEEYFFVNDYVDHGVEVYNRSMNVTDQVNVINNVRSSEVGIYEVKYQIKNTNNLKEIIRQVHIVDYAITNNDSNNLVIDFTIDCDNYYYTVLPDGTKKYSRYIYYEYQDVGVYEFDIYLKSGSHKKYLVDVKTIDKEGPVGTCNLTYENNRTIITMDVTDQSGVKKFTYNGFDFYGNTTTVNSMVSNVTIKAYDKLDNVSNIKCRSEYGLGFRKLNANSNGQIQGKNGYINCGTSVSKESRELELLMQSYGLKTRSAVAAAAVYLLTYKYNIPYFWGGKYNEKGFNPQWGCNHSHNPDHNCGRPRASDNSVCEWGLDCTGYTKWAFIQAGFDKSLIRDDKQSEGIWGGSNGQFNASKHKYAFSSSNINYANQIKPGDIVWSKTASGGHVGLVIGVSSDSVQIADMPGPIGITVIRKTGGLVSGNWTFTHFVLMDEFYKLYGNS